MASNRGEGASMARSPAEARKREKPMVTGSGDYEHDPKPSAGGEGASMARNRSAAHRDVGGLEGGAKVAEREVSSGGHKATGKSVDSEHAIGTHDSVHADGAEGYADDASSKANRKEAMEPEREAAEQHAVERREVSASVPSAHGGPREVMGKNVMGHGPRETKACNTV